MYRIKIEKKQLNFDRQKVFGKNEITLQKNQKNKNRVFRARSSCACACEIREEKGKKN